MVDANLVLVGLSAQHRNRIGTIDRPGGGNDALFAACLSSVTKNYFGESLYLLSLYAFSAGLGYLVHFIVRSNHLDHKYKFIRFNNDWYYLLTGEILKFPNPSNGESVAAYDDQLFVYLSTVVTYGQTSYLFRGIISDFWFDREGNLDRVLLEDVYRRRLSDDRQSDQAHNAHAGEDFRYYQVVGDRFIIRRSEMTTINLEYFMVSEDNSK